MSITSGIVLYIMIWWVVIFMVLPWGVRPSDEVVPGTVLSAPEEPRLWLKFLITSCITCIVWVLIYGVGEMGWISFRDLALSF